MTAKHDIRIRKGDTFVLTVKYKDSEGSAVDLTGSRIRMDLRESQASETALLAFDSALADGSATIVDAAAGIFEVRATPTQTRNLSVLIGKYDLEIIDTSGDVTTILEGSAAILNEVTRD